MKSRAGAFAGYLGYKAFTLFLAVLPRRAVLALGEGLGRLAFRLDSKHCRIVESNLAVAFGKEKPPAERTRLARRFFAQFGRNLFDILKATHMSAARVRGLIDVEGRAHLERALAAGKGVLVFTAHYGNWEFAVPVALRERAPPGHRPGPRQPVHRARPRPPPREIRRRNDLQVRGGPAHPPGPRPERNRRHPHRPERPALEPGPSSSISSASWPRRPRPWPHSISRRALRSFRFSVEPAAEGRYRMTFHEPLAFRPAGRPRRRRVENHPDMH